MLLTRDGCCLKEPGKVLWFLKWVASVGSHVKADGVHYSRKRETEAPALKLSPFRWRRRDVEEMSTSYLLSNYNWRISNEVHVPAAISRTRCRNGTSPEHVVRNRMELHLS
ncbi:hypothetical protein AVEN_127670-1 [Araneus ventricosus]|uniref:Uncharacterized protein n=1 Tax=Araneus ventricosus TaxID=182803 RepID=A0A4Y2PBM1_ARAVE|nr:hypothetical protein AVEN_127670-1 [Araneus ventricosus]